MVYMESSYSDIFLTQLELLISKTLLRVSAIIFHIWLLITSWWNIWNNYFNICKENVKFYEFYVLVMKQFLVLHVLNYILVWSSHNLQIHSLSWLGLKFSSGDYLAVYVYYIEGKPDFVATLASLLLWIMLIVFCVAGSKPFRRCSESIAFRSTQLLCADWDNRQWRILW